MVWGTIGVRERSVVSWVFDSSTAVVRDRPEMADTAISESCQEADPLGGEQLRLQPLGAPCCRTRGRLTEGMAPVTAVAHLGCPSTRWETIMGSEANAIHREPWNKGKIIGQKAPFKVKDIWALRVRLQMEGRVRELALSNLGIDRKLRGCDLVSLKVRDICHGDQVASRAVVMQHKTQRPVQFEITPATRDAVQKWIKQAGLRSDDFLFPSRIHNSPHLGTRQCARILEGWAEELGLDPADYGTHSMRRTKATLIYRRTKNLRAVQLLLGHSKLESTVRYLGIEVDDALDISEQTEI